MSVGRGGQLRSPAVAGSFYPLNKQALENVIDEYMSNVEFTHTEIVNIMAAVIPHAGYMYSGKVAAYSFKAIEDFLKVPPLFVIICPNHTGNGAPVAVSNQDWITPLGRVKIDSEFVKALVKNSSQIQISEEAHQFEHAVEVQLPFLQRIYGKKHIPPCQILPARQAAPESANISKSTSFFVTVTF